MKFTVDGIEYDAIVDKFTRTAQIKEGDLSGDLKSGRRYRDVTGTYYDYELTIATNDMTGNDYDALFEVLTAPVESHSIILPYGNTGTLTFEAYIESVSDTLIADNGTERYWGNLGIAFYALSPQRSG